LRRYAETPAYVTSDHRVAGSSPAGCKISPRADPQTIYFSKTDVRKAITCQSFATFKANPQSRADLAARKTARARRWQQTLDD
jgi:hypothetical protein